MNNLIPKIGLEIHLELGTKTKLFCACKNDPEETEPNKNICPICTGQPGVLPVLNKQAVIYAYSLAKALKMKINQKSLFARKHYFYPDLPKNYQISQYEHPLAVEGEVLVIRENFRKKVRIRRLHLEEDTASNIHFANYSLIDFNRSGIPLVEIVTEPELNSAEEVEAFAEDLVLLIRYLKISDASAEKGQIRFEANISLGKGEELGTKVEIKNIAKIKSLKNAVLTEIERQKDLISKGEKIIQETRGYDEIKNITFTQRAKEFEEDYRYFPEPDLPPLIIDQEIENSAVYVETPWDKRLRLEKEYNLDYQTIILLTQNPFLSHFFEESFSELYKFTSNFEETKKLIVNFMINDLLGLLSKFRVELSEKIIHPHEFAHLLFNFYQEKISSKVVKEALEKTIKGEGMIEDIIKEKEKISDAQVLSNIIDEVIKENQKIVQDYLAGKDKSLEFLIGEVMKKTKGRADPKLTREILIDALR
ncbi:MAG: aspartyl/glutamyl-tRNA(Asn/Gln) amidotransferase subunit B [Candidatus Parcubacteria bacterium]|nr:MAG: aspartyl/glutamyl-tRNA(Asn/Gln) amidotransferase subunit B [Candidatus Parcubacteria bacterium]